MSLNDHVIIDSFSTEKNLFLSPDQQEKFVWEGAVYDTMRNVWESSKARDYHTAQQLKNMLPLNATAEGMRLAETEYIDDWKGKRRGILAALIAQKFGAVTDAPDYRDKLLNAFKLARTGNALLLYKNYGHDNELGLCDCKGCRGVPGENLLGDHYMKARKVITRNFRKDLDLYSDDCYFCWENEKKLIPGRTRYLFMENGFGHIPTCIKHESHGEQLAESFTQLNFKYIIPYKNDKWANSHGGYAAWDDGEDYQELMAQCGMTSTSSGSSGTTTYTVTPKDKWGVAFMNPTLGTHSSMGDEP